MLLTTLCRRRSLFLLFAAATDKAGLGWQTPQSNPAGLLEQVAADKPRFALITDEHLDNPTLFTDLRAVSSDTAIVVCLGLEISMGKGLWPILDNLEFDALCTLPELTNCLLTLKDGRFFHSSLLETHSDYHTPEPFPGLKELTDAEGRVLKGVAEGKTAPQIADALYISDKTVNNHKLKIGQKMGVNGGPGSFTKFVLLNRERILPLLE